MRREGLPCATWLKRDQSAATSKRCAAAPCCSWWASAFSMSAYCCTGGQTMPAEISIGATKSGGRVTVASGGRDSVSTSSPPPRSQALASPPTTRITSASPRPMAKRASLMTSCCETPSS